jgi:MFS family permease
VTGETLSPGSSLWRHHDFLRLWAAQTISLVGSQVTLLALPLTAVILLHASALQVGLLTAVQYLPFLLVGLPAGVWVDRLRRRPILIVADLARALILLSIPVAYWVDALSLGLLYPVGFLVGVLSLFFDVAHQSYLPDLVPRESLIEGNAKIEISYSSAQLAGPGLGGVLVQVLTAPVAILADAASYVVSAALLLRIRRTEPAPARDPEGGPGLLHEIRDGVRYVLGHELLRPIALTTGIGNLFDLFGMVQAVLTLYAIRTLRLSPAELGLALAIANGGGIFGALANKRLVDRFGFGPVFLVASVLPGVGVLLLPLATPSTGLLVLACGLGLAGFAIAIYNVNQITLRQTVTPPAMQGRMNATIRVLIWGTIPIGAALGGFLGSTIGLRPTLLVAGCGSILACSPVLFSEVARLRRLPDVELEATAAPAGAVADPSTLGALEG